MVSQSFQYLVDSALTFQGKEPDEEQNAEKELHFFSIFACFILLCAMRKVSMPDCGDEGLVACSYIVF